MSSSIFTKSRRALVAALAFALLAQGAFARQQPQQKAAPPPPAPEAERLRAHVSHLASDRLEGRKTGTRGAQEAAEYVANEFIKLSLAPGGNTRTGPRNKVVPSEYMQEFPYVAGVELGEGNSLKITEQGETQATDLRAGEDWMPLGFSSNARVEGAPLVFAGFGITAAEANYDDYKAVDVKDKVALALSGSPDGDNPHGRFTRAGEIRFKAAAARGAGAKALLVAAEDENFRNDKLSALSYDNAGGDAGLPVAVLSRRAVAKILGLAGAAALKDVEAMARLLKTPATFFEDTADVGKKPKAAVSLSVDVVRKSAPAANVVGVLEGSDPRLKDEVVVVGAHYDHLGRGGRGSLAPKEGDVHHGADDNASGTAALLELARLLSADKTKMRRTVVFIAFGGEEEGLLGSSFYVNNPTLPVERTVAMLNMDMVGRLKDDSLMIGGVGTASEWRGWIEEANRDFKVSVDATGSGNVRVPAADGKTASAPVIVTGSNGNVVAVATPVERFKLRLNEDGFGPSDHSAFYAKRLPVLFFFTGVHEDYHKPSDTAERINYDGLARVTSFVRDIVMALQSSEKRPTFAVAKTESSARSTGFRVYLGTVPSYAESTDGLKIDAVREGSPAEAAGLRAGDKIVRLAGRDVQNIYDYTQALSGMKAGQEYEVTVVRDGQRQTLKVTPAARR
ncbi:MAG TPA: M20/M25/M40 family metallo-hydrolase [Pyrinomonadaceae bacterium]|nr:M20/M25/M40 family metallo-hydrolase [Pyrinomonadaceae bacterium]